MSDSWNARLVALFATAVELPIEQRSDFVEHECRDDPHLRAELLALLAADDSALARALDASTTAAVSRLPRAGDVVAGRYRILQQIGEGGMGVVFAAEQLEPKRRVALKCIRAGWLDADLLARFRREAALLGHLQHPGIAQIFEAGLADSDPPLPFLAMEYVDGTSLTDACQAAPLRVQIELFAQIAEAVAHAHERGIVHRDLKPANVLVEQQSQGQRARVLDFGVARFTGDTAATQHTLTHQLVGTLAYLSPEQIERGSASADARSDVWALGVTMYEILAGRPPLPLHGCSIGAAARLLREVEPTRLERLVPTLPADVATIVHEALHKDPAHRYPDAAALAADLRAFLGGQPIAARPLSRLGHFARFARRHRAIVAGVAIGFVALAIGLCVAVFAALRAADDRDRAQARTAELRAMLRSVVEDVDRELADIAGATPARRRLLELGLAHAEGMTADASADPALLGEIASTFVLLAQMQGVPGTSNLGDPNAALATLDRAAQLLTRAELLTGTAGPDLLTTRLHELEARESVTRALRDDDARRAALNAIAALVDRIEHTTGPLAGRDARARLTALRARFAADAGDFVAAHDAYRELCDALTEKLAERDERSTRRQLATVELHRASALHRLGRYPEARAALERAVAAHQLIVDREPDLAARSGLAEALRELAAHTVRFDANPAAALELLHRARESIATAALQEPQNVALQRSFLLIEFGIGQALARQRDNAAAADVLQRFVTGIEALAERPGQQSSRRDGLAGRQELGIVLGRMGRLDAATDVFERALSTARAIHATERESSLARDDLLMTLGAFGTLLEAYAGNSESAVELRRSCASRAIDLLTEQRDLLEAMPDGALAPHHRHLLASLRDRVAALRARLE